ncbi:MAG: glycoside hydrolase family 127 protein [Acidobacteriota bacterium]|nr:glycoside hydrolase family 127 protein [Acidobacteriota bacterium]
MRNSIALFAAALLSLGAVLFSPSANAAEQTATSNRAPLQHNSFNPLPLGAVRPLGWLLKQEEIQAAGLTGHLDEFWDDVGPNSGWLGGTGESWERGPYYLDGLLPLAYQLNNPALIAKAKRWVDWSLDHQQPDGQFGPTKNDDWWPRMVMLKVLIQYEEVTGDPRVIPFMEKYFQFELRELPARPLRDWGKYRWQDNVYTVIWLYNRSADKSLLALARLLHDQGYDWQAQFAHFQYTSKQTKEGLGLGGHHAIPEAAMQTHGVNNAMALKVAPVWWLVNGNSSDRGELAHQLAVLDKYHGLPNGMFSGDEHLAGLDPSQGIELCAVVESMFSFEEDFAILGDSRIADRLERVAYNALPATLSNDMWSHQYDQQPNQIACTRAHRQWSTNGNDSNLFGLQPNFGCCTANLHQGWPKFVSALWMATPGGGLVTAAYAPSEVQTQLNGKQVTIREETQYPFSGDVRLTIHMSSPSSFPLVLRIPDWAGSATVEVNRKSPTSLKQADIHDGFYALDRNWRDGDTVLVSFPMQPRTSTWFHDSTVFESGPLVFSLPLDGEWSQLKSYAQKSADWQITPTAPWNFGVEIGPCDAALVQQPVSGVPFDLRHSPVSLKVEARRLPQWTERDNSAGPLPLSPVSSSEPLQPLTLVPYGSAKLRITAFPSLAGQSRCNTSAKPAASPGK